MNAHTLEATLTKDRTLILTDLPWRAGDSVEVTIRQRPKGSKTADPYPLRGSVLEYIDPFEPAVPAEDWDVLK